MKKLLFVLAIMTILMVGCTNNTESKESTRGFQEWNEDQVYEYLNTVDTYTQSAYTKSFANKAEAQAYYQEYFSEVLSKEIVDFLFEETNNGLKLIEGLDGGYLFAVFNNSDESDITITIEKDYIHYKAEFEIGLYSLIEYTIENTEKPIITKWIVR